MKTKASPEDFAQTVTRLLKALPLAFIETLVLLRSALAPFDGLVHYVIAKTMYEPNLLTRPFEITPVLRTKLAALAEDPGSCRRLELFVRTIDTKQKLPLKASDVVFSTLHGLLRKRPDGPCLLRQLRRVARGEIASAIALKNKYGPRVNGARAAVAASKGDMTVFRRFASRLEKIDIVHISATAARNNWTAAFGYIVRQGIVKDLGNDALSEITTAALLFQPIETLEILIGYIDADYFPASGPTLL